MKPAWKTLGFWAVVVLTNLGLLAVSGVVVEGVVAQAIGWVVTVLSALGYVAWGPKETPAPAVDGGVKADWSLGGGKSTNSP